MTFHYLPIDIIYNTILFYGLRLKGYERFQASMTICQINTYCDSLSNQIRCYRDINKQAEETIELGVFISSAPIFVHQTMYLEINDNN